MVRSPRAPKLQAGREIASVNDLLEAMITVQATPWDNPQWPRPRPGNDIDFFGQLAGVVDQAANWVAQDSHGPMWGMMLESLADHLDHGCTLPAHGRAVRFMALAAEEALQDRSEYQTLLQRIPERLNQLAAGMRYYMNHAHRRPARTWQAPSLWPQEVQAAVHEIGDEIERAAGYCGAWSLFGHPQGAPESEMDCTQELWSRIWSRSPGEHWFGVNARPLATRGAWHATQVFLAQHQPARMVQFMSVKEALEDHDAEVERGGWSRSFIGSATMPPVSSWARRLEELAAAWRIGVSSDFTEKSQRSRRPKREDEKLGQSERPTPNKKHVIRVLLGARDGLIDAAIAKKVGCSEVTVHRILRPMRRHGCEEVINTDTGWKLSRKGREKYENDSNYR